MNKSVQLGLSILEISKIVMYEFWYDNLQSKYRKKLMLHGYIELYRLDNIINYKNSVNYKTKRPLPKEKK